MLGGLKMAKMSIEKKTKLIYSLELIIIAIVLLVVGLLELLKVIPLSERFQTIFKYITLVGAAWMIADFVWMMASKKRRERNSMLDKVMLLPLAGFIIGFDIAGFVYPRSYEYYQIGVPLIFFYLACSYLFQGIYHYYVPIPMILEAIEEEKAAKEEKENQENQPSKEVKEDPQDVKEEEKGE